MTDGPPCTLPLPWSGLRAEGTAWSFRERCEEQYIVGIDCRQEVEHGA